MFIDNTAAGSEDELSGGAVTNGIKVLPQQKVVQVGLPLDSEAKLWTCPSRNTVSQPLC